MSGVNCIEQFNFSHGNSVIRFIFYKKMNNNFVLFPCTVRTHVKLIWIAIKMRIAIPIFSTFIIIIVSISGFVCKSSQYLFCWYISIDWHRHDKFIHTNREYTGFVWLVFGLLFSRTNICLRYINLCFTIYTLFYWLYLHSQLLSYFIFVFSVYVFRSKN